MKLAFYLGSLACYAGLLIVCYMAARNGTLAESITNGVLMAIGLLFFVVVGFMLYLGN